MRKPRLLDLFAGAGGAAVGYARAGFEVVGVDVVFQKHYPFEFHQGDAMTWPLEGYDAIHASPPCQHYANVTRWRGDQSDHPDLLSELLPFEHKGERAFADAMGCEWMTNREAREAVPPAFTEFIGTQLLAALESVA